MLRDSRTEEGVVNPTPGDRVMLSSCCHPPSLLSSLASCEMATEYEVQPKHEHETGRRVHLRVKSGESGLQNGNTSVELQGSNSIWLMLGVLKGQYQHEQGSKGTCAAQDAIHHEGGGE